MSILGLSTFVFLQADSLTAVYRVHNEKTKCYTSLYDAHLGFVCGEMWH